MKKINVIVSVVLGVLFVIIAVVYWTTPAGNLPSFMPGFQAGSTVAHFKHGLAAIILAAGSFIYAWFASGTPVKKTK